MPLPSFHRWTRTTMAVVLLGLATQSALADQLDDIRKAIDKYKDLADKNQLGALKVGTEGYPETLEMLVEGVKKSGAADQKIRFLRRIPKDPMTNSFDWGIRSMQDDPRSTAWGGQNVFDVYTKSMEKAADGTPYAEW